MQYISTLARQRATSVWGVLMAATLISWTLGTHHDSLIGDRRIAAIAVVAIAFIKVYFVGIDFMELRHAPRALRLVFNAWIVITAATVGALFLWA